MNRLYDGELDDIEVSPELSPADQALERAIISALRWQYGRIIGGSNAKNLTDAVTARLTDQGFDIYPTEDR